MNRSVTTLDDELSVGKLFTFEGERQIVGSWHSNKGDRFILASPLMNPNIVIRHMWSDLEMARHEGRI